MASLFVCTLSHNFSVQRAQGISPTRLFTSSAYSHLFSHQDYSSGTIIRGSFKTDCVDRPHTTESLLVVGSVVSYSEIPHNLQLLHKEVSRYMYNSSYLSCTIYKMIFQSDT